MEADLIKPLRKAGPAGPPSQCLIFISWKFTDNYKPVKTIHLSEGGSMVIGGKQIFPHTIYWLGVF